MATDVSGATAEEVYYYPFGATRDRIGNVSLNHKYTGQELDPESGLYYYGARYYDPELGRFLTPDSIVPYPNDPQSFNRYSYVRNNPLNLTDPSGNWDAWGWLEENVFDPVQTLFAAAGGAIGGALKAAVTGGDVWRGMIEGAQRGIAFVNSANGFLSSDTGDGGGSEIAWFGAFVGGFIGGFSGSYPKRLNQPDEPPVGPPGDVPRSPYAPPGYTIVAQNAFLFGPASAGQGSGDLSASDYEESRRSLREKDGLGDDGIRERAVELNQQEEGKRIGEEPGERQCSFNWLLFGGCLGAASSAIGAAIPTCIICVTDPEPLTKTGYCALCVSATAVPILCYKIAKTCRTP